MSKAKIEGVVTIPPLRKQRCKIGLVIEGLIKLSWRRESEISVRHPVDSGLATQLPEEASQHS